MVGLTCRTGLYAWVPVASRPGFWYAVWRRVFRNISATIWVEGISKTVPQSWLCPIQHPSGGRGAHSDRNCARFSTHRGVRKPFLKSLKNDTKQNACFLGLCRPKILGREQSEPHGNHFCCLLGFRRSRGNKNSRHVPRWPPCPALLGIFAATHAAGARM